MLPKGWAKIPPDLAVEVVSPNETAYELEDKLEDYQKVGVPLVWVINPNSRTVRIHRSDGSVELLTRGRRALGRGHHPRFPLPGAGDFPAREPINGSPSTNGPNRVRTRCRDVAESSSDQLASADGSHVPVERGLRLVWANQG